MRIFWTIVVGILFCVLNLFCLISLVLGTAFGGDGESLISDMLQLFFIFIVLFAVSFIVIFYVSNKNKITSIAISVFTSIPMISLVASSAVRLFTYETNYDFPFGISNTILSRSYTMCGGPGCGWQSFGVYDMDREYGFDELVRFDKEMIRDTSDKHYIDFTNFHDASRWQKTPILGEDNKSVTIFLPEYFYEYYGFESDKIEALMRETIEVSKESGNFYRQRNYGYYIISPKRKRAYAIFNRTH